MATVQKELIKETEVQEPIPTATVEIRPPRFASQKPELTPQEELDEARRLIEQANANNLQKVIIPHDLKDLAWQKLSQEGYKIKRQILPKLGNVKSATQDE